MPIPKVSEQEKCFIIAKLEEGQSIRSVARHFHHDKSTILRIKKRWEQEHTTQRKIGSGRKRISTPDQDNELINRLRQDPFASGVQAASHIDFPGSQPTVSRRVKESELRNAASAKKTILSAQQKQGRIIFCLNYVYRPLEFWKQVIFSDEKIFQSSNDGRIRVYRPRNCRFEERYVNPSNSSGRFSVHVWAWMCVHGPGVCWRVEGRFNRHSYINILENVMLPSVSQMYPENNFVFQQDNCPVHTANDVRQWFQNHNIEILPWPAYSPDVNPVENLWGLLVKRIYKRNFRAQNANELWETIHQAWEDLYENRNQLCENLINSMPRRLNAVININGAMTKY